MIALTILPFTPAKYILKNVLNTKKTVNKTKSKTYWHFHVGITILISFFILIINMSSTFPFPPYCIDNKNKIYDFFFVRCEF